MELHSKSLFLENSAYLLPFKNVFMCQFSISARTNYHKFSGFFFFPFIFISWRLITLQYCTGFCHTLTWISHGFTCIPHPDPPLLPPSLPDPSGSSQCTRPEYLSHASNLGWWCFTLDNIHVSMLFSRNILPSPSPTESTSLFCTSVSLFSVLHIGLSLPSF